MRRFYSHPPPRGPRASLGRRGIGSRRVEPVLLLPSEKSNSTNVRPFGQARERKEQPSVHNPCQGALMAPHGCTPPKSASGTPGSQGMGHGWAEQEDLRKCSNSRCSVRPRRRGQTLQVLPPAQKQVPGPEPGTAPLISGENLLVRSEEVIEKYVFGHEEAAA